MNRVACKRVFEDGLRVHEIVEKAMGVLGRGERCAIEPEFSLVLEDGLGGFFEVCGRPDMVFYDDSTRVIEIKYSTRDRPLSETELLQVLAYALMAGGKNVSAKVLRVIGEGEPRVKAIEVPVDEYTLRYVERELKARLRFIELEKRLLGLDYRDTAIPGPYCVKCELRSRSECPVQGVADFVAEYYSRTGRIPPFEHILRLFLREVKAK